MMNISLKKDLLKSLCLFFTFFSLDAFADSQALDKWLNIQFYNTGGYASWYEVEWQDGDTQKRVVKTSSLITAGYTYEVEIPERAKNVYFKAYSNTGLVWEKSKLIVKRPVSLGSNLHIFGERYYYAIQVWGTTLSPRWAIIEPTMGVDGLDPYSNRPRDCAKIDFIDNNYGSLLSPNVTQYDLINRCKYDVIFNLRNNKGDKNVSVGAGKTHYHYDSQRYSTYDIWKK